MARLAAGRKEADMNAFLFTTKLDLTYLLGRKAKNAEELRTLIAEVPAMSVYYHTHHFLYQHNYLSPEPPNDFAFWATNVLNDDALGEQLASIDIIQFVSIDEIRARFLEILDGHNSSAERAVEAPRGEEFHFMSCQTFAFPTSYSASSLREFREQLERVSVNSLYFHMFDARLRLKAGMNDFSLWFQDNGYPSLAEAVRKLDPYTYTLEGLRRAIIKLVESHDKN